jgi:hypothetical protein
MGLTAATRRLAASVATIAMLFAALAPSITHALASAHGQHFRWTEVCTTDGARLVPVPTDADGVPVAPNANAIDHCPFCSPGGTPPALPAPEAAAPRAVAGPDFVPPLQSHAPRPLFAWPAAQPRAPPLAS